MAFSVNIYSHGPPSMFHHGVSVNFNVYVYVILTLIELGSHYANPTLSVSCTRSFS